MKLPCGTGLSGVFKPIGVLNSPWPGAAVVRRVERRGRVGNRNGVGFAAVLEQKGVNNYIGTSLTGHLIGYKRVNPFRRHF